MKKKIVFIDKTSKQLDGSYKRVEKEFSVPDKFHLYAQIKYPAQVYKDKTKYCRKQKHKNKFIGDY